METWYCLIINSASHYGKSSVIVEELEGILQSPKPKFIVIEDKEIKKTGEYMIFVSSPVFLLRKETVVKLSAVLRIVENNGSAYPFSEKEVQKFVKSIEKNGSETRFKKGDVVIIREGYLKNLFGLVTGKNRDGSRIKVLFKFYVRSLVHEFSPKELRFEKSIYDEMPCNIKKEEWFERFS